MRKILYVLCLLTTLVACSDDDDKIITDYDKPYTKLPSSELRTLIEDNISSCEALVKEFSEMEENNEIFDLIRYYDINLSFNISDFINSRSSDSNKENTFTGMKLVWNKDKQDFDTTINAAGFMEVLFPSSKTDRPKMIFVSLQRLIIVPVSALKWKFTRAKKFYYTKYSNITKKLPKPYK